MAIHCLVLLIMAVMERLFLGLTGLSQRFEEGSSIIGADD